MSSNRRLIRVPSETYVYAEIDPDDLQQSASNIMLKLAGFRSYTILYPFEDVDPGAAPEHIREQFESGKLERQPIPDEEPATEEDEEPIELIFTEGAERKAGVAVCRLRSATYVAIEAPKDDETKSWEAVRGLLGTTKAVSVAEPEVEVVPLEKAPDDVQLWVLYAASDRVVVPLWPEDQIENPERVWAWKEMPQQLHQPEPYSGPYVRVVAVYPEHVRGMLCRMWHQRRDESPGIGTVRGKYPVDVAVSVPSEKRTPHIHSFQQVETRDWRPGLVFYTKTDEDGCPVSYVGKRLDEYCVPRGWVPEKVWRAWLGAEKK
ncbi:MAG: hypothetical protein ACOYEW_08045 [Anaerolineae bacterium]|jgi:hypothetical protein